MVRRLNRHLLDQWIEQNGPDGLTVLAYKSGVSASTIQRSRYKEEAPKKLSTLLKLSNTMGFNVDALFPIINNSEEAS